MGRFRRVHRAAAAFALALLFTLAMLLGGCSAIAGLGQFTKDNCADGCDGGTDGTTDGKANGPDGHRTDGSGPRDGAGDHEDAAPDAATLYSISGKVTGLKGTGLALTDSLDTLPVKTNGTFTFTTRIPKGATYKVTVATEPSSPTQACTITGGSGTMGTAPVTNVLVTCTTQTYAIGGTVTGLSGSGLVLQDNSADNLPISGNGPFKFSKPVASGTPFSVSILTQPTAQTCVVSGATGTVGTGNVTSVVVNCTPGTFTVGGTISGLAGTVVLQDNAGDNLTLNANGSFAFATPLATGATYAVTVLTQPITPSQTCSVGAGNGTIGSANITSVTIKCSSNAFTVGGIVAGLAGSGLVLQDNGGDNLPIAGNGAFTFPTSLASGSSYTVTVLSQPKSPAQLCSVSAASGIVTTAAVTSVKVTCTTQSYTIGGSLSGLAAGATVVLQDNGGDNLTLTTNGSFTFASPISSGATYAVTVLTQPASPLQVCTVSGGNGTVGSGNVTSITVNCATDTFTVGGTVSGLAGTLVLQNNGGDNLSLTANGTFAFTTPIASGAAYAVTVLNQPSAPSQTCKVASGSGTVSSAAITSVVVTCTTNSFTVGGNVSGLVGSGLTLLDNGGDSLGISGNGPFTFAISLLSGSTFAVSVGTEPTAPTQTCTVTSGSGTVGASNVTTVVVTCKTQTFTVGGTLLGLDPGDSITLQDDAGDNLTLVANGSFTFTTALASGKAYAVTVFAQPTSPSQTCTVSGGTGTVSTADVASVIVNCGTNSFTVGGNIYGLAGTVVLQDDGGDNLTLTSNGSFAFPTPKLSGATYVVTVLTQPMSPAQTCTVSSGTGTVGGANVTTVVVNCSTDFFTVGGTISGLGAGDSIVLQDNAIDNLTVSANGSFTFTTPIASGASYAVTVFTQPGSPISQTCLVTNASGSVTTANITNVTIACTTNFFTIGGKVSGLAGSGLVLQDNGGDNLSIAANGSFTFTTSLASGTSYTVTVLTEPTLPTQLCTIASSSGTVGGSNVKSVMVTCTTQSYTIGGTVSGLTAGATVVLQDNGGDNLTVSANGGFTFGTPILSGNTYAASVLTQPPSPLYCYITNGSGIVGGGNVTTITVTCATTGCGRFSSGFTGSWSTVAADPFTYGMGLSGYLPAGGATSIYLLYGGSTPLDGYSGATNTYTSLAAAPLAFPDWPSAAWYNNSLWAITGADVIQYDISAGTWSTVATGLTTPGYNQTTSDDAGNLWSFESNSILLQYNIASGVTTPHTLSPALTNLEARITYDSCSGLLYVTEYSTYPFYSYNPTSGVQVTLPYLPSSYTFQDGFCGDRSGHIFAMTDSATMYQYTISTNTWTALPAGGVVGTVESACGIGADGYLYATDPGGGTTMYRIQLN